jgi:hypothetical protein
LGCAISFGIKEGTLGNYAYCGLSLSQAVFCF